MDKKAIPFITTDQMVEVDRLMEDEYNIGLIQMMEIAGRQLARLSRDLFFHGNLKGKKVVVLAGSGGNGGGALVSARNLHNWGADVEVVISKPKDSYTGVIRKQVEILTCYPIPLQTANDLLNVNPPNLIIDGVIGYSLRGAPRGPAKRMIQWAGQQTCPLLALDVPSGIDSTTGEAHSPVIQATATMTLALPKTGLRSAGKKYVGDLYLADIGVPPELYAQPTLSLQVGPLFQQSEIIRLPDLSI
jgi:NAD(P)H-hydrate epimerase